MDSSANALIKGALSLTRRSVIQRKALVLRGLTALSDIQDADYYFFKGESCRMSGDTAGAVTYYERALTVNTDHKDALFYMGYCLMPDVEGRETDTITLTEQERFERVYEVYQRLLRLKTACDSLEEEDFVLFCNIGLAAYHLNQLDESVHFFKQAIELNPHYDNAYLMAGVIHDEQGAHRDAAMYYHQAIELNPENGNAWHNLGLAQQNLSMHADAVESFRHAIELNPGDADTCYAMGTGQERIGFFHRALDYYQRFFKLYSESAGPNGQRMIDYVNRRIQKIRTLLTDTYYFNTGTRLWESGEKEEAMACFEIAVELRNARKAQPKAETEKAGSGMNAPVHLRKMKGLNH